MSKINVLFVCIHNSARSQMAEAFVNQYGSDKFFAESAGLEPGQLNQRVVHVLKESGIDISGNETNAVVEFINQKKKPDYIITVCDETSAQRCPVFPGAGVRLHWSFEDPSSLTGSEEEILQKSRIIRDKIKEKVINWMESTA